MQSAALIAPQTSAAAPLADDGPAVFDPLLDPHCRVHAMPPSEHWPACWIWYPGQLAAHRHAACVRASMERCTDVGYPGNFRQAENIAYFRRRAALKSETAIRWNGPPGRIRLILNGDTADITLRKAVLPAGAADILAVVDFTSTLPCLILDGAGIETGAQWEASLDQVNWVEAEADPVLTDPLVLPDSRRELTVDIRPLHDTLSLGAGDDVIVDFWHDELGALAWEASGTGTLSVVVGESLQEVQDAAHFEQRPLPPITISSQRARVVLPERCVRYARFRSSAACEIRNLRLEASVWPVNYRGRFESSDAKLNAIWSAGAATIHANMHSVYLDGIRRDALPWWDGLLVLEAGECVFFDAEVSRQTILALMLPANPRLSDMGLIDTQLFLLAGFENEYLARGDVSFSRRYRDHIEDVLGLFLSLQDERGLVNGRNVEPYGFFPDWSATEASGPDAHGTPAYAQMLLMRAFEIGGAFAVRWGDAALAERYRSAALKLRHSIRELFWDRSEGAFINGLDRTGAPDRRFTPFAQVYAVLFDLASPAEWNSMFNRVLNNPARRASNLSISQPWEFLAYAKAGRTEELLARLRAVWGGLLDRGLTRFPEDIRMRDTPDQMLTMYGQPFGNSLCHAWAGAAPVLALARGVLGIWPLEGGYRRCRIAPRLGGLEWVRGSVPTPTGDIGVDIDSHGARVTLPEQVTAELSGYVTAEGANRIDGPGTFGLRVAL
jgi:hypothetical protein